MSETKEIIIESKRWGKVTVLIDEEDWERANRYKWSLNRNVRNKHKIVLYVVSNCKLACEELKRGVKLHRFITNCPSNMVIDHINSNTLDNRKANLRICTRADNKRNRGIPSNNTLGYKGVALTKSKKKYMARIGQGRGKHMYLGTYDTIEEAAKAYDTKAKELFGEYAHLNFPND